MQIAARSLLSIIIPTYNSEASLEECLQSIVAQTYPNIEVIIVDGLSTDRTRDIVESFRSSSSISIKMISEKDKGIYDAMNKGINAAGGEWLFFLGSDDSLYSNEVLEKIFHRTEILQQNVIYGNVLIKGASSWAKDGDHYDGAFDTQKLLRRNICHQSIFYRSSFIKNEIGQYNIAYKVCADWDFNLRCWSKSTFFYVDDLITNFSGGGESTKNNYDEPFVRDFVHNVVGYFKMSLFDPLINDSSFPYYHEVLSMQRKQHFFRYAFRRFKSKFFTLFLFA